MKISSLEYISTIKTSGTIGSSSKHLINKCLKGLNFNEPKIILEFGMGNGCITKEILKKVNQDTTIYSFETNPKFYKYSKNKFKDNCNLNIYHTSALNFDKVMKAYSINKVDYVISSLPISLFEEADTNLLLNKIKRYLSVNGRFVQYQYSLNKHGLFKSLFKEVKVDFALWNLPPAFIYNCRITSLVKQNSGNALIPIKSNE
ncbi:class I SAM-dependent methyltransferase [Gelidibacter salicanalis]|uniref:Methyltransferase domain-containing protein n=1 Tax=Gelidibacter salicanalis TaxID=291193 RepID=A0A934NCH9_9FLAO|nr:rRNA adenine N-6-methyltransferase family protein [Gelidibacter salicanalis]MBJ7880725.1 methyltransferase domain-containing protein [Gelidibacter salicanalis]